MYQALAKILKIENNVIKTENKEPLAITARVSLGAKHQQ